MKKVLVGFLIIAVAGCLSYLAGYYFSSGRLTAVPEIPGSDKKVPPAGEIKPDSGGYSIRVMEELSTDKDWSNIGVRQEEVLEEEIGDARVIRRPMGKMALGLLVDASQSLAGPRSRKSLEEVVEGLKNFLDDLPGGLAGAGRTMGGSNKSTCEDTRRMMPLDDDPGLKDKMVLDSLVPGGPRNISRAMYLAAGDMATFRGRKGLVVITAGEEECGEWPCETAKALHHTRDRIRTYVLEVQVPEPEPEEEEGAPEIVTAVVEEKEEEPSVECLPRVGDGFRVAVMDDKEVTAGLIKVYDEFSRNTVFRFYRSPDHELTGESAPDLAPWSLRITPLTGSLRKTVTADTLPAHVHLPPGKYQVRGNYRGTSVSIPDLTVAEGEEVEVHMTFRVGQLLVTSGERGWKEGSSDCSPLVRVFPAGSFQTAGEACGLPAHFILRPGRYDVSVFGEGQYAAARGVAVSEGRAAVKEMSPAVPEETLNIDNQPPEN